MANGIDIGKAYVQIVPSAEGITNSLTSILSDESEKAGTASGNKFSNAFGAAAKVAGVAISAATTAVTGFAKTSIEAGMEFDTAMSQVAATMNTTVDQITDLRDYAQEMGATTAFSATEAAEALNYMALAGYDSSQSIEMLPSVLNLAAAGSIELARASDMVTDVQSALSLSSEETARMVDQMASAAANSNTSVEQLGDALLTVGGTAKNLSGGVLEASTALGVLANSGIKGAEGGTALRNVILSLTSPTSKAAEAMERLGIEVFDAAGNMRPVNEIFEDMNERLGEMTQQERIGWINTVFNKTDLKSVEALLSGTAKGVEGVQAAIMSTGVEWEKYTTEYWYQMGSGIEGMAEDIIYNLFEIGSTAEETAEYLQMEYNIDEADAIAAVQAVSEQVASSQSVWDDLTVSIDDSAGAAQRMADTQLDNLEGDIVKFKSALEGAEITMSDKLTPSLREFVQYGTESISDVTRAFKEEGLGGAMEALGEALSNGLAMVIEMAPEFIKAGGQLLMALVEGIIENAPAMIESAMECVVTFANGLAEALPELIPATAAMILQIVDSLIDNVDKLYDAAIALILGLAEGLIKAMPELVRKIPDLVQHIVEGFIENAPKLFLAAIELISTLAIGLVEAIPELIAVVPSILMAVVEAIIQGVPKMIDAGVQMVKGIGQGLVDGVKWIHDKIKEVVDGIVNRFKELFGIHSPSTVMAELGIDLIKGLGEGISETWSQIVEFFRGAWQEIISTASELTAGLVEAFTKAKDAVAQTWDNIADLFSKAWEAIQSVFENVSQWFSDKFAEARNAISDAWDGITESFEQAWEAIQTVFDGVADWFGDTFESARDFAVKAWEGAAELFHGVWQGIQGAFDNVSGWFGETFAAAKEAAIRAWDQAVTAFQVVWQSIQGVFSDISGWFETKFGEARDRAVRTWEAIQDKFATIRDKIETVFNGFADWAERTSKGAMEKFAGAWNGIKSKFQSIWKSVKEAFSIKDAIQWGKDLVSNFSGGITNGVQSIISAAKKIASTVKSFIGFSEPETGPLSDFHTYAPDMMKLFAQGILNNTGLVQSTLEKAFSFDTPTLDLPEIRATNARLSTVGVDGNGAAESQSNTTYNFYSPKALDPVSAMREAKKASQRMALAY